MKVGFVGAGKVGCSLGKHLASKGVSVIGFYSRSMESAVSAADFTKSNYFSNLETLIEESDVVFITVPDDCIGVVWDQIKDLNIAGKMICHCSGSLSSKIFSGIEKAGAFGFSVHPLLAVSDRYDSYQEFPKALFTIEGCSKCLPTMKAFLKNTGLTVGEIDAENKTRYHAAAVFGSNLVVALMAAAQEEFAKCGLSDEMLHKAIEPLILGNVHKVLAQGAVNGLTGPVERNDVGTISRHLLALDSENKDVYRILSKKAITVAKAKHPDSDYSQLENILNT
ncbi:MAG: DUF2520 domain-containing protein [Pseudobutyrivibrio sp.]|nr:DUF2520 domain-containing protein [Pseudobutyrivibrio sp.]